jgi:hypothetical protein
LASTKVNHTVESILGLNKILQEVYQSYVIICRPLFDALKKNAFQWSEKQEQAFLKLKTLMSPPPVLALTDFSQPFILEADASGSIGAVLMQQGRPNSFLSKTLGQNALAASIYEKEAIAILEALKNGNIILLALLGSLGQISEV